MIFPVILSGGFGGRLWPVSRASYPKQFISLITENTLLQETLLRLSGLPELGHPILVCNTRHRFIAAEQLRAIDVKPRRIFLEPIGRNTAPAIAVSALDLQENDPDATMLVLPSDHVILHVPSFHKAIREGEVLARAGYMVTFGILPTSPKTGYGYIRQGKILENGARGKGYAVEAFVEKPDVETAKQYLESRQYLWNSGIFMFKASKYLDELREHAPALYEASLEVYRTTRHDVDFSWLDEAVFESCPSDSIDYAIMEKTQKAAVVPVDMGWSDVGSWGALWEVVSKDIHGNAANGHVFMKDVSNCYIKSGKEIVAALGIDDLIVIDTDDALLIAHMSKEQEVKDVFKKLM
jgi:mannose-1-phosphate guanylyltransferase/mannose-6-phosphate isomerase